MSGTNKSLIQDALLQIIKLVNLGQERGSYTLDDAVEYQQAIKCFTTNGETSSKETQEKSILTLVSAIEKAQKKGNLLLNEAFVAYQAILIVTGQQKPVS